MKIQLEEYQSNDGRTLVRKPNDHFESVIYEGSTSGRVVMKEIGNDTNHVRFINGFDTLVESKKEQKDAEGGDNCHIKGSLSPLKWGVRPDGKQVGLKDAYTDAQLTTEFAGICGYDPDSQQLFYDELTPGNNPKLDNSSLRIYDINDYVEFKAIHNKAQFKLETKIFADALDNWLTPYICVKHYVNDKTMAQTRLSAENALISWHSDGYGDFFVEYIPREQFIVNGEIADVVHFYSTVPTAPTGDYDLTMGVTHYMSADATMAGNSVTSSGSGVAYIKPDSGAEFRLTGLGTFNHIGSEDQVIYWTSINDDSVGESMSGVSGSYTGTPAIGDYTSCVYMSYNNTGCTMHHAKVRYLDATTTAAFVNGYNNSNHHNPIDLQYVDMRDCRHSSSYHFIGMLTNYNGYSGVSVKNCYFEVDFNSATNFICGRGNASGQADVIAENNVFKLKGSANANIFRSVGWVNYVFKNNIIDAHENTTGLLNLVAAGGGTPTYTSTAYFGYNTFIGNNATRGITAYNNVAGSTVNNTIENNFFADFTNGSTGDAIIEISGGGTLGFIENNNLFWNVNDPDSGFTLDASSVIATSDPRIAVPHASMKYPFNMLNGEAIFISRDHEGMGSETYTAAGIDHLSNTATGYPAESASSNTTPGCNFPCYGMGSDPVQDVTKRIPIIIQSSQVGADQTGAAVVYRNYPDADFLLQGHIPEDRANDLANQPTLTDTFSAGYGYGEADSPFGTNDAIRFDGVDDEIAIEDVSFLSGLTKLTMSYWIRINTIPTLRYSFRHDNTPAIGLFSTRYNTSSFQIDFHTDLSSVNYWEATYANLDLVNNDIQEWNHFHIVFDGSQAIDTDKMKVWVNGTLVTTTVANTIDQTAFPTFSNNKPYICSSATSAVLHADIQDLCFKKNVADTNPYVGRFPISSDLRDNAVHSVGSDTTLYANGQSLSDLSSLGRTLESYLGATYNESQNLFGGSFGFDGTTSQRMKVGLSGDAEEVLNGANELHLSFWFNIDIDANTGSQWFCQIDSNGGDYVHIRYSVGGLLYVYADGGRMQQTATNIIPSDVWTRFDLVYDSSGATDADICKIYINGELTTGWSYAVPFEGDGFQTGGGTYVMSLGNGWINGSSSLTGYIEDFQITHAAPTQEEVQRLMNNGAFNKRGWDVRPYGGDGKLNQTADQLPFELLEYNSRTGSVEMMVKDSLVSATDSQRWLMVNNTTAYGDSSISNIFYNDYAAYYKMNETSGQMLDYSPNGNHSSFIDSSIVRSGFGYEFDAASYLEVPNSSSLNIAGDMYISVIIRSNSSHIGQVVSKRDAGGTNYQMYVYNTGIRAYDGSHIVTTISGYQTDIINHIAFRYTGDNVFGYKDGVYGNSGTQVIALNDAPILIGKYYGDTMYFDGDIFSIKIKSGTPPTADEVTTESNNTIETATFWATSGIEPIPGDAQQPLIVILQKSGSEFMQQFMNNG